MLPSFIICGTERGGTTSLYYYLLEHPAILPARFYLEDEGWVPSKELHYFNSLKYFTEDYEKYFDPSPPSNTITFEATPDYLANPVVPSRIFTRIPKVKLITLLRDPINRAYSAYTLRLSQGLEFLPFHDAIMKEMDGESIPYNWRDYITKGIYIEQLRRWFDDPSTFSRDQMLILRSEDFFTNTQQIINEVCEFLEIPVFFSTKLHDEDIKNHMGYPGSMSKKTRELLIEFFTPYNTKLYDYLGRDFGWAK